MLRAQSVVAFMVGLVAMLAGLASLAGVQQAVAAAQGAIIGKAMTPLKEGKGLVLVLVSLQ